MLIFFEGLFLKKLRNIFFVRVCLLEIGFLKVVFVKSIIGFKLIVNFLVLNCVIVLKFFVFNFNFSIFNILCLNVCISVKLCGCFFCELLKIRRLVLFFLEKNLREEVLLNG